MAYYSGVGENVVKTALDQVFFTEFDYPTLPGIATAETEAVFKQDTTDRAAVITEQLQGVGYWEERPELATLSQASPQVDNQKTFSVINYARELEISKNMFDDDLHTTVSRLVKDFARTGRLTRDRNAFSLYNGGFTTTLTNDGVALFSNTHTTLAGGDETVDNLETAALSETSLYTAVVSLMEQVTQDGTLGAHEPACLLVPPALWKTAMEITKSELRSGTANNDMNYYSQVYPGLMVYQSPFLGAANDGSDTAWFLLSRNHSMFRWVRQGVQTEMIPYQYQRNNVYIYKAEYREVVGPITWEGMVASNGTT